MNHSETHKLALFVEGQTEQIFAEKLVRFLGEGADLAIRVKWLEGGRRTPRQAIKITGTRESEGHEFFVLIVNCGQDERVKSDIREDYDRLVSKGFQHIVGIRDVFSGSRDNRNNIERIRKGFQFGLRTDPIAPALILAIMEIEAWLLAEYSHFPRIHPSLTPQRIRREFGFDPATDDMRLRDHPARDLEAIYFLETIPYDKSRQTAERTINHLDFSRIRDEVAARFDDLQRLVGLIRAFFDYSRRNGHAPLPQP